MYCATSKHIIVSSGQLSLRICDDNPKTDFINKLVLTPDKSKQSSNCSSGSIIHNKKTGYLDGCITTCIDNSLNCNSNISFILEATALVPIDPNPDDWDPSVSGCDSEQVGKLIDNKINYVPFKPFRFTTSLPKTLGAKKTILIPDELVLEWIEQIGEAGAGTVDASAISLVLPYERIGITFTNTSGPICVNGVWNNYYAFAPSLKLQFEGFTLGGD